MANPIKSSLKKGDKVRLRNSGFAAVVLDNEVKKPTRECFVHGLHDEMGSVYADLLEPVSDEEFEMLVRRSPDERRAQMGKIETDVERLARLSSLGLIPASRGYVPRAGRKGRRWLKKRGRRSSKKRAGRRV